MPRSLPISVSELYFPLLCDATLEPRLVGGMERREFAKLDLEDKHEGWGILESWGWVFSLCLSLTNQAGRSSGFRGQLVPIRK